MKTASYYRVLPDQKIQCELCPHNCQIPVGKAGFCNIRTHQDGTLVAANYGQVSAIALDPIEKKPLYHFYPGRPILSVGTVGCNLACEFCQNWHISREQGETRTVTPEELMALAMQTQREHGNIGLAYTYSEPVVWYEFLVETMPLVREAGLKNVLVTNAFLHPEPWNELLKWADAANIDLKGFKTEYYRRWCHGQLQPVLENIRAAAGKIHLELTTLLIPGENDDPEQLEDMVRWIAALDPDIPLHLSRYYPNYKMDRPATTGQVMEQAYQIAKSHLNFVYLGNLGANNNTVCHQCGKVLVERHGYTIRVLAEGRCPGCGEQIPFVMED
ncbi:MAG TPA: AmmeMemoRadiSam system radical SAM enzyme [Bacillota bacterium]|nr:AmmeMemoRadiSam system radical SAM enzyme [Bacillota bacterium]